MRKVFLITFFIWICVTLISLIVPYPQGIDKDRTWIVVHTSFVILLTQIVSFIASAVLLFREVFSSKQLGGIIGKSLKVFSVGFGIIGISQIQLLVISYLGVWSSAYATSGISLLGFLLGLLCMLIGLIIGATRFIKGALISVFVIAIPVILYGLIITYSQNVLPGYIGKSLSDNTVSIWVDGIMTGILVLLATYSVLLRRSFGKSEVGDIFGYLIFPFVMIVILQFINDYFDIVTWPDWFLSSGAFYIPLDLAGLGFFFFALKFRYRRTIVTKSL